MKFFIGGACIGLVLAITGHYVNTWQFWVLLMSFVAYGEFVHYVKSKETR